MPSGQFNLFSQTAIPIYLYAESHLILYKTQSFRHYLIAKIKC